MGVKINGRLNEQTVNGTTAEISEKGSSIRIFVIPTNEELVIARDTAAVIEKLGE